MKSKAQRIEPTKSTASTHSSAQTRKGFFFNKRDEATTLFFASSNKKPSVQKKEDSKHPAHTTNGRQGSRERMAKKGDLGGLISSTKPRYKIEEVKKELTKYNEGPIKGMAMVNKLNSENWNIRFWKKRGRYGEAFRPNVLYCYPKKHHSWTM